MEYHPTLPTIIFVAIFVVVYISILIRNAIKNVIDLYDFLLLSSVATIPFIFVFFPKFVSRLADLVGVEFELVILFSALFVIIFIYLYRIIIIMKAINRREVSVIQELSLLRHEFQKLKKSLGKETD